MTETELAPGDDSIMTPIVKRAAILDDPERAKTLHPNYIQGREHIWQKKELRAQASAKRAAEWRARADAAEREPMAPRDRLKALTATNSMPRVVNLDGIDRDWRAPKFWWNVAPDLRRFDELEIRISRMIIKVRVVSVNYHERLVQLQEIGRMVLDAPDYPIDAPVPQSDVAGHDTRRQRVKASRCSALAKTRVGHRSS
jgi:hypothetical protein